MKHKPLLQFVLLSFALLTVGSGHAAMSTWTASSGLYPDQISPPWTLVNTASPEVPVLSASYLTLSTSANAENMYYEMSGANLAMPANLVIEFSMKYIGGSSTQPARAPGIVGFATQASIGNSLSIGLDTIFLQAGELTVGSSATVDTDGAFHTYRIEVTGTGLGSAISVFQDSNLILSGATYTSAADFGSDVFVSWGEGSSATYGEHQWESFSHNAAVPEPSTYLAGALLLLPLAFGAFRKLRQSRAA